MQLPDDPGFITTLFAGNVDQVYAFMYQQLSLVTNTRLMPLKSAQCDMLNKIVRDMSIKRVLQYCPEHGTRIIQLYKRM